MTWIKRGLVFAPQRDLWWAKGGYAFLPTVDASDDTLRIYFASLDEHKYGRVGYVDLDPGDPGRVLHASPEPILDIGALGAFDDCGVNASCVIRTGGRVFLYYIGWQRCERVPYMLFGGLAIADRPGGPFQRYSRTPVFDRTPAEPFSRSAPCVLVEAGRFRAWYWTCEEWTRDGDWTHYNNTIRYAESPDGVHWTAVGGVVVAPRLPGEYSVGRPWVVNDGGLYRMWFSTRSRSGVAYRIDYADSTDGVSWTRRDEQAGIDVTPGGWDSEMVCFPCVADVRGRRYMFYNGNHHGRDGFGYAVLEG